METTTLDMNEFVINGIAVSAYNIAPTFGWEGAREVIDGWAGDGFSLDGPCHVEECDCGPDAYRRYENLTATPEQVDAAIARAQEWAA
ncbi:hypothetical protein [Saccharothrix xinjiangensis]|uniref:Uncharacterized protein n=1 Tax=Saccharothrix xinjiangensis TaxID=204798 RepID=A0ABV9XTF8_9PSEU